MAAAMGSKDRMTLDHGPRAGRLQGSLFFRASRLAQILRQHVAKEGALLDGVIESDVSMRVLVEPVLGHAVLGALAVVLFQDCHGVSFDVQR